MVHLDFYCTVKLKNTKKKLIFILFLSWGVRV